MKMKPLLPAACILVASGAFEWQAATAADAAGTAPNTAAVALTGKVTSAEEGAMEGVLVSAKKTGSVISYTVATDATGRYSFPRAKVGAGPYTLKIRAAGYDLVDPGAIQVSAAKTANAELKLVKAKDVAAQLSNSEWLMSMPGTYEQKDQLLNCVQCHTLERIVRSKHTPEEWLKVIERMGTYANQSTPLKVQKRKGERLFEERGAAREAARLKRTEFLASINQVNGPWKYDLKTLPRLKGNSNKTLITEYDLPRRTIQPHDVILDADGMVWYSSFGEQTPAKMDPVTGKITEINLPVQKEGWPLGQLGLQTDTEGNLWFGMTYQAALAKVNRKTLEFNIYPIPEEFNKPITQINMAAPQSSSVDGKIWMQNNGFAAIHRMDMKTGKFEFFTPFKDSKEGENHNIYDVIPDKDNNAWFTDFYQMHIGKLDAKTGEVKVWPTPTKNSAPRRGQMDDQGRLWFGEYHGNRLGMFDTKKEKFQEWESPTPFAAPYDAVLDKAGYVWTGSMSSDRVLRLNTKTNELMEFQLPRSTNIRRVFVDNRQNPPALWIGNNHGASIIKLEVLE
ncbi:MAG: carboxypeptidase regulatory-like domain-containing protein [Bryobacteraceae bacterium]